MREGRRDGVKERERMGRKKMLKKIQKREEGISHQERERKT